MRSPIDFLKVTLGGVRTDGPMVPDVDLSKARKAEDVHEVQVKAEMERAEAASKALANSAPAQVMLKPVVVGGAKD